MCYSGEGISPERIYSEFRIRILGYVRARVKAYSDAEDMTEEIMLRVIDRLNSFDSEKASLATWVYAVARNYLIDFYRRNQGATEELSETLSSGDGDGLSSVLDDEMMEHLARALEKLGGRERDMIILRFYEERDLQDIARIMDMSYGNVRVIMSRALKKLKQLMETLYPAE